MARRLTLLTLLTLLAGVLVAVPGPHDHARAASGGTNGRIAFVRYTGGAPLEEVYMVSPASGLTANLTNDPATSDTAPAWSPDGTRVALQRSGPVEGIWVLEAASGAMSFVVARRRPDRLRPRRRPGRRPALPHPRRHPGHRQDRPGHQRPGRRPAAELAAAVASTPRMLELAAARS